jgi:hypothetical protein
VGESPALQRGGRQGCAGAVHGVSAWSCPRR